MPSPDAPDRPVPVRKRRGDAGEALAARHLRAAGLIVLERGYRRRVGEIDLIAVEPATGTLVFVEVRYRASMAYGGPLVSVCARKRARLLRTVRAWLAAHRPDPRRPVRIDVVGITSASDTLDPREWQTVGGVALRWVRGALSD